MINEFQGFQIWTSWEIFRDRLDIACLKNDRGRTGFVCGQAGRVDGTEESHLQFYFVHCLQTTDKFLLRYDNHSNTEFHRSNG